MGTLCCHRKRTLGRVHGSGSTNTALGGSHSMLRLLFHEGPLL